MAHVRTPWKFLPVYYRNLRAFGQPYSPMAAVARNSLRLRGVLSVLARKNQPASSLLSKEPIGRRLPSATWILTRSDFHCRCFQTEAAPADQANTNLDNNGTDALKPNCVSTSACSQIDSAQKSVPKQPAASDLKISARHDLAMMFTCSVCDTRSIKTCSRESYEKGVVVARCGGCNNLHLIADRLGWFGEPGSIEDFLSARGKEVKKGSLDTLNLTLDDIAGKKILPE